MIPSEVAGIIFTANPATGDRNQVMRISIEMAAFSGLFSTEKAAISIEIRSNSSLCVNVGRFVPYFITLGHVLGSIPGDRNQMVINASFGLGEAVAICINFDEFCIFKLTDCVFQ